MHPRSLRQQGWCRQEPGYPARGVVQPSEQVFSELAHPVVGRLTGSVEGYVIDLGIEREGTQRMRVPPFGGTTHQ
jgi:hypothetical protein